MNARTPHAQQFGGTEADNDEKWKFEPPPSPELQKLLARLQQREVSPCTRYAAHENDTTEAFARVSAPGEFPAEPKGWWARLSVEWKVALVGLACVGLVAVGMWKGWIP